MRVITTRSRRLAHPQRSIGLLVEQRYLTQAQPVGLYAALERRGHAVTLIDPAEAAYDLGDGRWASDFDLVVGRGRSCALLCQLAAAESWGRPTLNRRAAIAAVHNKAEMAITLAAGRLPTPSTFLGCIERLIAEIPAANYPLILKPIYGDNSRGLRLVQTPAELVTVTWPEPIVLAQTYLPSDGYDIKLYGIGDQLWAVRKPSSFHPFYDVTPSPMEQVSELLPLTPAMRDLGRRCGELFGLALFGVDCLQTPAGLVVIEVNDFPNYTGVPEASEKLTDYILALCDPLEKREN